MSAFCLIAIPVDAQIIKSIDFSSASGYQDGLLEDQPAGDADVWFNGASGAGIDTSRFVVENEQLVVTQNEVDNQWIILMIPVQQGFFTATWDWQYIGAVDSTVDFGFTLSDTENFGETDGNPNLAFGEMGVMVRMNADPDLDVRNGDFSGGGTYETLVPYDYRDGAKISMRVDVDAEAWLFDAYAQKEGEDEFMIAEDYGFRLMPSVETNGVNCIALWSNGDEQGNQVILDNILLYGETPVQDWSLF